MLGIEHRALDLLWRSSITEVYIPQYVKNFEGFFQRFADEEWSVMNNGWVEQEHAVSELRLGET